MVFVRDNPIYKWMMTVATPIYGTLHMSETSHEFLKRKGLFRQRPRLEDPPSIIDDFHISFVEIYRTLKFFIDIHGYLWRCFLHYQKTT